MIKPFYLDLTEEEIDDIQSKTGEILRSGNLILGQYTKEFENKFASYIGTKYAVALNTCTSTLELLCVMKEVQGKKVAVQTNTNFATVAAIIRAGGKPVFMDMDKDYFVSSLTDVQSVFKDNSDIAGIAWVHIGGIIHPQFLEVVEFCKNNDLFLIEDCAHAHGSQFKGIKAGNFADGGAFSFFPTKVMTTMEGGMLTTNSKEEADFARSMRNQGKRGGDFGGLHSDLGNSWRINEISAYMGLVQLAKLDQMLAVRQKAVDSLIPMLTANGIKYCSTKHMDQAAQYKIIIKFNNNEAVETIKEKFKNDGVILGGGVYEVPCYQQPVFSDIPVKEGRLSVSEHWCPRHICPPITSGTTEEDTQKIIRAIVTYIQ
jgi:perosamine synthetase